MPPAAAAAAALRRAAASAPPLAHRRGRRAAAAGPALPGPGGLPAGGRAGGTAAVPEETSTTLRVSWWWWWWRLVGVPRAVPSCTGRGGSLLAGEGAVTVVVLLLRRCGCRSCAPQHSALPGESRRGDSGLRAAGRGGVVVAPLFELWGQRYGRGVAPVAECVAGTVDIAAALADPPTHGMGNVGSGGRGGVGCVVCKPPTTPVPLKPL